MNNVTHPYQTLSAAGSNIELIHCSRLQGLYFLARLTVRRVCVSAASPMCLFCILSGSMGAEREIDSLLRRAALCCAFKLIWHFFV